MTVSGDRLSVCNSGVGGALDAYHIFERFYKADEARTRGKHGTGLGLYIVSNIITNHDGTITADSLVGEGTTFTIKLPENRKE